MSHLKILYATFFLFHYTNTSLMRLLQLREHRVRHHRSVKLQGVVYKVTCNGCSSIYVGRTSRHVTTRISGHQKKDSPVGQHLVECCGTTHNVKWQILDACRGVEKRMTIEAIYIKKLKPQLNTLVEYRGRELTLKY